LVSLDLLAKGPVVRHDSVRLAQVLLDLARRTRRRK